MPRLLLVVLATAIVLGGGVRGNDLLRQVFEAQQSQESSLVSAAVVTVSRVTPQVWAATRAFGSAGKDRTVPMQIDSSAKVGVLSEMYVAFAAVKLLHEEQFAQSLDVNIDGQFLPGNAPFVNPTTTTTLTYRMLLTHTSSLIEGDFSSAAVNSGEVESFVAYMERYFLGGLTRVRSDLFSGNTPGSSDAYQYSRSNTALMAYILQKVIERRGLPYQSIRHYIESQVLAQWGAAGTYFLTTTGVAPGVTPYPTHSGEYIVPLSRQDPAFYASYFAGNRLDVPSSQQIHPAYPSDYMAISTTTDTSRMAREIFIDARPPSAVTTMRAEERAIDVAKARPSQAAQGIGLVYYDPLKVCAAGIATGIINQCPFTNTTKVSGYIAAGHSTVAGFVCVETTSQTYGTLCVATTHLYSSSGSRTVDAALGMMAAVYQDLIGVTIVDTPVPTQEEMSQFDKEVEGIKIFFGVFGTVLFVLLATWVVEVFMQPKGSMAAQMPAPTFSMKLAERSPTKRN